MKSVPLECLCVWVCKRTPLCTVRVSVTNHIFLLVRNVRLRCGSVFIPRSGARCQFQAVLVTQLSWSHSCPGHTAVLVIQLITKRWSLADLTAERNVEVETTDDMFSLTSRQMRTDSSSLVVFRLHR